MHAQKKKRMLEWRLLSYTGSSVAIGRAPAWNAVFCGFNPTQLYEITNFSGCIYLALLCHLSSFLGSFSSVNHIALMSGRGTVRIHTHIVQAHNTYLTRVVCKDTTVHVIIELTEEHRAAEEH